jgi:hypothetical protein
VTTPIVRIYETDQQASEAFGALRAAGFGEDLAFMVTPGAEDGADPTGPLAAAILAGSRMRKDVDVYAEGLKQGRSLVVALAPFGHALEAITIMDRFSPVPTGLERPVRQSPEITWDVAAPLSSALRWRPLSAARRPAPFSDMVGIAPLSKGSGRSKTFLSSNWTFSSLLGGLGLLSPNPTPISSVFGLKTLQANPNPGRSSFGIPLIWNKPAPLSALTAVPTMTRQRTDPAGHPYNLVNPNWTFSRRLGLGLLSTNPSPLSSMFGLGLLSSGATPLSSVFGLKALFASPNPGRTSFGMPLLWDKAAPTSALLGMPALLGSRSVSSASSANLLPSTWNLSRWFGLGLLSTNPSPLSSMFGLKTLSADPNPGTSSFGIPLSSNKPTALSSLFGLPVLSRQPTPLSSPFGLPVLTGSH